MSTSVVRRSLGAALASLLALGAVPLFGFPSAHAGIASVSPTTGNNAVASVELTIERDGSGSPFAPTDHVYLLRTADNTDQIDCGTPTNDTDPGVVDTLVVTCPVQGRAPGAYDVFVDRPQVPDPGDPVPVPVPGPEDDVESAAFTIFGGTPVVTGISGIPSPASRGRNSVTPNVTLNGLNLSRGSVVEFFVGGVKDTAVTWTTTANTPAMTTMTGTVTVGSGAMLGLHTIRVTTTSPATSAPFSGLTINPEPVVTSYFPAGVGQGANGRQIEVTGTGFQNGVTAALAPGETAGGITVGAVTFVNATTVRVAVSATDTASLTPDQRLIRFTNPDGGRGDGALKVRARPTIAAVSPTSYGKGASTQTLAVTGTNFVTTAGQQTTFSFPDPRGVTLDGATIVDSANATLTVTVPASAEQGGRQLTVTNFDGGTSTTTNPPFTVNEAPVITNVSPASMARGAVETATVTGTNFVAGMALDFGPGVSTGPVSVAGNGQSATVTLTIANDAVQGPRSVKATNPDKGTTTAAGRFSIDALGVTGVLPTGLLNGGTSTITISGSGFTTSEGPPTVVLTRDPTVTGQPPITATNVAVTNNGSQIEATIDLTQAAPGTYRIRVTNVNGDTGLCRCTFTVTSPTPTLTQVAPNTRVQGAQDQTLVLTGTGFSNGAIVGFQRAGITVQSLTVDSPTKITLVVDVSPSADTTIGNVTVTLANNVSSAPCANCFKVNPAPSVTNTNPSSRGQASTGTVLVNGQNFLSGATVAFGNPDVTVNGAPSFISATQLSVNVTVAPDAALGATSVTVTNPDTGVGACAACFTVNPKPTLTGVSPNKGGAGKSVSVLLTGTGFPNGTPNVSAGPDIVAINVNRISATSITATFVIGQNATQTTRDVLVVLGDGGQATCAQCFSVVSSPTISSVSPSARAQGTTGTITVTGTGFETDGGLPTLQFSGAGLVATNVEVASPTSLTASLVIEPAAPTGTRALTITNADGGSGICNPCFTVNAGPTVTSISPSSTTRGRQGFQVTITGEGFTATSEPLFGTGITVVGTPVRTINATAADTIAATIDIAATAPTGARQIGVRNPADGATGVCSPACFTVAPGRTLLVEVFDTKGTAATTDDVLTDKPVSGGTYRVRVTAKIAEDPASNTDTAFAGPITLSSPNDGAFVPGTCADAVAGVAACTDVKFGDLGLAVLVAKGSGDNADRVGTLNLTVEPPSLEFTATPPTNATTGQALSFSFRPAVGLPTADRSGYAGTRRIELTGTGASLADGATLSCGDVTCTVNVTWSSVGTKTVQFADGSAVTPVVTVQVAEVGIYKPLSPARILDTRRTADGEPFSTPVGANRSIDLQVAGRGGVPASGATAVVVNVTVTQPTGTSYLTVWPAGQARPLASTMNFVKGQTVANLAVLKLGSGGKVSIYNQANSTHVVMDVVGYYTDDASTAGGRLVSVAPARVFDTSFGSRIGTNSSVAATVLGTGGVPASDVTAVVVSVTAVRPTGSGYLTVYPDGEARPLASTVNFPGNRTVANLAYAKVGNNGKIRVYNALGTVHVTLDVVGYVTKTGTEPLGQFVSLAPHRILDTRGSTGGLPGRVNSGRTITPKVVGIPAAGLPASGVDAVIVNVTVTQTTGTSFLTVYPTGMDRPNTSNVQWFAGQTTANLAVVKVGPDGRIAIWNKTGATHVILDVVGYMTA